MKDLLRRARAWPGKRDVAFAFSFASLMFYEAYSQVLLYATGPIYFVRHGSAFVHAALGGIVAVVLLALAAFAALRWAATRESSRPRAIVHGTLLALLAFPAASVAKDIVLSLAIPTLAIAAVAGVSALGLVVAALGPARGRVVPSLVTIVMLLTPFGAILGLQMGSIAGTYAGLSADSSHEFVQTHGASPPSGPRVVWIVLDELDEAILTNERPAGLQLPEFDRLRSTALAATNASSPAAETMLSIPSLLLGRVVVEAGARGPDDFAVREAGEAVSVSIRELDTAFSDAQARGRQTAAIGWFHPYCKVFAEALDACHWVEGAFSEPPVRSLAEAVLASFAYILEPLPGELVRSLDPAYSRFSEREYQEHEAQHYVELRDHGLAAAGDRAYGLVFIHMNIPHLGASRGFFDRHTGSFTTSIRTSYVDNLVLADHFLGALRGHMEAKNAWNATTLIVTGDHGYRPQSWGYRIGWADDGSPIVLPSGHDPRHTAFLVKAAGQIDAAVYSRPFDTVITRDLVDAILEGRVDGSATLAAWLDRAAPARL